MARIRYIKPELFLDEELAKLSVAARLCFIGLWTLADRMGRLEDRPARIRAQLFPYDDFDVAALLEELAVGKFIIRYECQRIRCIEIRSFQRHQRPHPKEAESSLPSPYGDNGPPTWLQPPFEPASNEITRPAAERVDLAAEETDLAVKIPSGMGIGMGIGTGMGLGAGEPARACDPMPLAPEPGPLARARFGVTPQLLLDTFGRLRADIIGGLPWQAAGSKLFEKARQMADTFAEHPESAGFIEPSMRMVLERARDSQDPRDRETAFSFGAWVARFTDLVEEIRGMRRGPSAPPKECAFHRSGRNQGKRASKVEFRADCPECKHLAARAGPRPAAAPEGIGELIEGFAQQSNGR